MRVFVTGHRGYIGVHLVDLLKQAGHDVTGCDLDLFEGCAWDPYVDPDKDIRKDVRQLTAQDLDGHDCIMHLAAISNDPMGDLDPSLTLSINRDGSINLAKLAKQVGVDRFLFSGSCAVYGFFWKAWGFNPATMKHWIQHRHAWARVFIALVDVIEHQSLG